MEKWIGGSNLHLKIDQPQNIARLEMHIGIETAYFGLLGCLATPLYGICSYAMHLDVDEKV